MMWVKSLPCLLLSLGDCRLVTEADHVGLRTQTRKSNDDETIPLCTWHHVCRTVRHGFFAGWTHGQMRTWCDERIAETKAIYASLVAAGTVIPTSGQLLPAGEKED